MGIKMHVISLLLQEMRCSTPIIFGFFVLTNKLDHNTYQIRLCDFPFIKYVIWTVARSSSKYGIQVVANPFWFLPATPILVFVGLIAARFLIFSTFSARPNMFINFNPAARGLF